VIFKIAVFDSDCNSQTWSPQLLVLIHNHISRRTLWWTGFTFPQSLPTNEAMMQNLESTSWRREYQNDAKILLII